MLVLERILKTARSLNIVMIWEDPAKDPAGESSSNGMPKAAGEAASVLAGSSAACGDAGFLAADDREDLFSPDGICDPRSLMGNG